MLFHGFGQGVVRRYGAGELGRALCHAVLGWNLQGVQNGELARLCQIAQIGMPIPSRVMRADRLAVFRDVGNPTHLGRPFIVCAAADIDLRMSEVA